MFIWVLVEISDAEFCCLSAYGLMFVMKGAYLVCVISSDFMELLNIKYSESDYCLNGCFMCS